jgi:cardiolipin synthase
MQAPVADMAGPVPRSLTPHQGPFGTSSGINIAPGSDDDGWIVPQAVRLDDGTHVQLYKDGEALHAAYSAISRAQRRVCLEVYIFRSDDTGRAFAQLLADKARAGVSVYLIYDAFGCLGSDPAMFRQMAAAGVRLAVFHPVRPWQCRYSWRPFIRDHRKLLIIDDDIAGLGGLNIGAEYAGSWIVRARRQDIPWRDTAAGLRGPSARLLLAPFARVWRYIHAGGRLADTSFWHDDGVCEVGVMASAPTRHSPVGPLRQMLRKARHSILLTMSYFAPPETLVDELCRAARRGVRVRLMLPGVCDVKILMTAARSFYEKLLSAGVEIYERQGAVLHAKTLCIDTFTTILGSTNLDYRSIEYNCEISVIVRNARFGVQMHYLFENDVGYARRITLSEWRRRPVRDRLVQWAVNRARYLL